ncbi:hypothetical protein MGYG_06807 [Nannizzia gypsea CBS 118893]|uniref:Uncharacterized protein n=1 Tax=Arthroderma gypseum (strain ATCC MYA-4604 / CBS 118893) TaxID=535722 RepID=E4V192_ARTGP|nr:hypothetical protein MGYG_06807 [Nannizzia gypsea CBS 118893]EFR03807.1 hypothetical protein MGYG_06807 [Nannizzia gypsea CBS 118893]
MSMLRTSGDHLLSYPYWPLPLIGTEEPEEPEEPKNQKKQLISVWPEPKRPTSYLGNQATSSTIFLYISTSTPRTLTSQPRDGSHP